MIHAIKRFIPRPLLTFYHLCLAYIAGAWYGHPSKKMIVIGVTGTNGKTTTAYLLAKALEASGFPTGCTSSALLKVGQKEWMNKTKMTMPGRFFLQRMLKAMVRAGCRYAVIETSSQGLIQYRHKGVAYDAAVFTNLTPEHIEAHGGFEKYKAAKRMLFEHVATRAPKMVADRPIHRTAILNADSEHADYFASVPGLEDVRWYSVSGRAGMTAEEIVLNAEGSSFVVNSIPVTLSLPGSYNVENALAVLATCDWVGIDLEKAIAKIKEVRVPGRFEKIDAGQPWNVIVDYAPEPESLKRLYEALKLIPTKKMIHVLGSCGGGRDRARRAILGRMAGERSDVVIATNEDPYDDDPMEIIHRVADGAREAGKEDGKTLFEIQDRREAIFKAMQLAEPGDLVLMTGKGCEPWMCLEQGRKIPWNEAEVAKEAIRTALAKPR